MRAPDSGGIGDDDGRAVSLVLARDLLSLSLGADVRTLWGFDRRVGREHLAVRRQQRAAGGDVDDGVQPQPGRRAQHQVCAADVGLPDALRLAAVEGVDGGGVEHGLAALHRPLDGFRVGDVADDRVDLTHPQRLQGGGDPVRRAHE